MSDDEPPPAEAPAEADAEAAEDDGAAAAADADANLDGGEAAAAGEDEVDPFANVKMNPSGGEPDPPRSPWLCLRVLRRSDEVQRPRLLSVVV